MLKAASLTGALLVAKGGAAPSGQLLRLDLGGAVRSLPTRPRRRSGGERNDGAVRLSLRLSPTRHRRLRLAAAHLDQSSQALMIAALDHYLDTVLPLLMEGRCACLEQGRRLGEPCAAAALAERTR